MSTLTPEQVKALLSPIKPHRVGRDKKKPGPAPRTPDQMRAWLRTNSGRDRETDCWLWMGTLDRKGYGAVGWLGKTRLAHRVAFELFIGPIPDGLTLDHLCRVRHCINPVHLEPVTTRENLLRGDTLTARHAAKTHCVNGHEFTPENTVIRRSDGSRICRACNRESCRRYQAARKQRERASA